MEEIGQEEEQEVFDTEDVAELLENNESKNYKLEKILMEKQEEIPEPDDQYRTHMSWMPAEPEKLAKEESPLFFVPPSGEKEHKSRRQQKRERNI